MRRTGAGPRSGKAEGRETKGIIKRCWEGQTAIIVASGPSLTQEDIEKAGQEENCKTFVVNSSYTLAPWADVLYACDLAWWDLNYWKVQALKFQGELWTSDEGARAAHDLNWVRGEYQDKSKCWIDGLSLEQDLIRYGGNSGHQAINLAVLMGCMKIILLGFDMQHTGDKVHFFGDHPKGLNNASIAAIKNWRKALGHLNQDAIKAGIEIINCSRETALTDKRHPPRMSIDEAFIQIHSNDQVRWESLQSRNACAAQ